MSLEPVPSSIQSPRAASICDLFARRVIDAPDQVAYRYFERPTRQRDVSFREYGNQVRLFAQGLLSMGLPRGARVAVIADQGPEWTIADLGILSAGCVAVAVPTGLPQGQLLELLSGLEVRLVVCGNRADAEAACAAKAQLPGLERVVGFGGAACLDAVLPLGDLMGKGRELEDAVRSSRPPSSRSGSRMAGSSRVAGHAEPDELALIMPSTVSRCRSLRLTHRQLVESATAVSRALRLSPEDVALPVLPMHDVAEHVLGMYARAAAGSTTSFMAQSRVSSLAELDEALPRINPTVLVLGPAELEHFARRVADLGSSPAQRPAFEWARRVGLEAAQRRRDGIAVGMKITAQCAVADSLVWARARELLGRKLRAVACWGVAANSDCTEWLQAAGVLVVPAEQLDIPADTLAALT